MTTRFMKGTPYEGIEQEMQQIPGFHPRGSGMTVSRLPYCANDSSSHLHDHKTRSRTCENRGKYLCLCEQSAIGCIPFETMLEQLAAEVAADAFVSRVAQLAERPPSFFFIAGHRERFEFLWRYHSSTADEGALCAAWYLLSADQFLWGRAVSAVRPDRIFFQKIHIHGVDLNGYILFHAARDLYQGTKHIRLSELTDPNLIENMLFGLIVTAFLIRRHGTEVLKAERNEGC